MTPFKGIKPVNYREFSGETGQVINLSWGIKRSLHLLARSLVHDLHVFDYDGVTIIQHKPPKLKGTTKFYESKFDVLLVTGKKVKYSVSGISLTRDYKPFIETKI